MNDIVRNYVLKMKIRNKIGLKLSRWVGYTEIPKEVLSNQDKRRDMRMKALANSHQVVEEIVTQSTPQSTNK
jgi:hypothetical protein